MSSVQCLPRILLKIDQDRLKMENRVKFLGVTLFLMGNCVGNHTLIIIIIEKCKKRLNHLRAISGYGWGAFEKTLLTIYKALIRSILNYGDVAYSSACKSFLDKLTRIKTEALRLCCGAPRGTAQSALQNECGSCLFI